MRLTLTLILASLLLPAGLRAGQSKNTIGDPAPQDPELVPSPTVIPPGVPQAEEKLPAILRWMIHTRKRGMFINLPIIDTDPNRGTTIGVLPVWVIPQKEGDNIEQIYAPSITYNKDFKVIPTFRSYYYPDSESSFLTRGSVSTVGEKEALVYYQSRHFLATWVDFSIRGQYNVDGSNRFYGLGPASAKNAQSDYTEDVFQYDLTAGIPLVPDTPWMIYGTNHFAGEKFYEGKLDSLPNTSDEFPGIFAAHRQQVNETRAVVQYDTRDSDVTTKRGGYLQAFYGWSVNSFSSAFDYTRAGFDGRYFLPWNNGWMTTASQLKYDQVLGNAPFWLQSRLGGKYSLRAYGDGRYIDRGAMFWQAEQRLTMFKVATAGVMTEFELAPFAGVGTVFDSPGAMQRRYVRPVVGSAVRAVARPQVVGSVDVGVGQEGVSVFMDINYSF